MASGADTLGFVYAKIKAIPTKEYRPDWNLYGKSAGILRNIDMAQNADALIAFWDGKSRGTKHMIETAKRNNLLIKVVLYET